MRTALRGEARFPHELLRLEAQGVYVLWKVAEPPSLLVGVGPCLVGFFDAVDGGNARVVE